MKRVNLGILISVTVLILSFFGFLLLGTSLKASIGDNAAINILLKTALPIFGIFILGSLVTVVISFFFGKSKETEAVVSESHSILKKVLVFTISFLFIAIIGAYTYIVFLAK